MSMDVRGIRGILFDMDGVLVNSETYMMESAMEALLQWNVRAVKEDFRAFIGAGEARFVGGVAEKHGVPYVPEMKRLAYEIYDEKVKGKGIACPHVRETLTALKDAGFLLAVCSSADRVKVAINLRELGVETDWFTEILSGDRVEHKKPAPDIFLKAAEAMGLPPASCVVVEDAVNGILAAKAAGMRSVGITTSFTRQQLMDEAGPDEVIDDLAELSTLLIG